MSHFYNEDGELIEGGLRVARKNNLFPSVTTVMKVLYKFQIEKWKCEQCAIKALNTERGEFESPEKYGKRIFETAFEKAEEAADFGTTVHNLLEDFSTNWYEKEIEYEDRIVSAYKSGIDWLVTNMSNTESIPELRMVSKVYGFAGTIDLYGSDNNDIPILLDWKTQSIKYKFYKTEFDRSTKEKRRYQEKEGLAFIVPVPAFYDEWKMQLAAGRILLKENGYDVKNLKLISVVLGSNEEKNGMIFEKYYTEEEMEWAEGAFLSCLSTWRYMNKFFYAGGKNEES